MREDSENIVLPKAITDMYFKAYSELITLVEGIETNQRTQMMVANQIDLMINQLGLLMGLSNNLTAHYEQLKNHSVAVIQNLDEKYSTEETFAETK